MSLRLACVIVLWLAQTVSEHGGSDDVSPMFMEAKKVPAILISDGASNFHHAWKDQYEARNFLHKDAEHHRHIHLAGDTNNNQVESFNGNTPRSAREGDSGHQEGRFGSPEGDADSS